MIVDGEMNVEVAWAVALYFLNTRLVAEQDRSEGIIADVKSRAMVVFAGTESDLGDRLFVCGDEFTAADILAVEDFTIAAQYL